MTGIPFCSHLVRYVTGLLAVFGVLVALGCASQAKKAIISGKVTYKGEAVGWGDVRFFSSDGALWSSARLNSDGTFTATDVPPGEVQVAVKVLPLIARPKKEDNSGDDIVPVSKTVSIPSKYQDPKTSGLRYTIVPGTNQLDIDLP
jgi:hypothetical protein